MFRKNFVLYHFRTFAAALIIAFFALIFTGPALSKDLTVKIMPLGDSITYGTYGTYVTDGGPEYRASEYIAGYRLPLYQSLTNAGCRINFVGSLNDGSAIPDFDPEHEGHGGFRSSGVAFYVYEWLKNNPADVILLHIGTNDFDPYFNLDPSDVEKILDKIDLYERETGKEITVVLARIINRQTYHVPTTHFNDNVQAMAFDRIARGDRIILVDQEGALNYLQDMADVLHPNDEGYAKMAEVWLDALSEFLPGCFQAAPQITSIPVIKAWAGEPYTYGVMATGNPAPTYKLKDAPRGMNIDKNTGRIEWTPGRTGLFDVTVEAVNKLGKDSQQLTLVVGEKPSCLSEMTHYWRLEETSAPYMDSSGVADALCIENCPASVVDGKVGGAQEFNREKYQRVFVPDDDTFDWSSTDSFSVEFWMMKEPGTDCANNEVIVGRNDRSSLNQDTTKPKLHWWVGVGCHWGNSVSGWPAAFWLIDKNGNEGGLYGKTNLVDGLWHHIVALRDAVNNDIRIYVDGALEVSEEVDYSSGFDSAVSLDIGWLNEFPYFHFDGIVDEIALHDRALSNEEIRQHYERGRDYGVGYCESGAMEEKMDALHDLVALRATVDGKHGGQMLDKAIRYLTNSLDPVLWTDSNHLNSKHGQEVFKAEKEAVNMLQTLIAGKKNTVPEATLREFIDRLVAVDRILASVAIEDAKAAGANSKDIAKAEQEMAKADKMHSRILTGAVIEHYRNAWEHAQRAKTKKK